MRFGRGGIRRDGIEFPCRTTVSGATVHIDRAIGCDAFLGSVSANGTHLSGVLTMGRQFHWTAPMQIDVQRTPPATP
jgi:hypothetical protein